MEHNHPQVLQINCDFRISLIMCNSKLSVYQINFPISPHYHLYQTILNHIFNIKLSVYQRVNPLISQYYPTIIPITILNHIFNSKLLVYQKVGLSFPTSYPLVIQQFVNWKIAQSKEWISHQKSQKLWIFPIKNHRNSRFSHQKMVDLSSSLC